ncbi:melanoma-associated antigen B16-like [Ctenodactylus gundi]
MAQSQATAQCFQDEDPQVRSETHSLEVAQVSKAAEEHISSSSHDVVPGSLMRAPAAEAPITPEGAQKSRFHDGYSSQEEEDTSSSTCQAAADSKNVFEDVLDKKASLLANFMLLKYKIKEPIRKEEMLQVVIQEDEAHFPAILLQASERLQLLYGLDVKEVDSIHHCYGIFIALGLTYDGIRSDEEASLPKTGFLIVILCTIFMKGNRATEEEIWEAVRVMGFFSGKKRYNFGDPRKLITEDFVKEKYLEYRPVANSDPVHYEFLWGPRAYAETTKMKVLEFFAKVVGCNPSDFPAQYEEAVLEEAEKTVARISLTAASSSGTSASFSATGSKFSPN